MRARSKLDELARDLTYEERQELLDKINQDETGGDGEYFVHVEMQDDEKQKLVHSEIEKLSLWKKFVIWFIKFLSGKSPEQVYISMRLREIKNSIRRANPSLTGFETRDLSVRFIRHIFDLYSAIFPMLPFYRFFSEFQPFQEQITLYLVEKVYGHTKRSIDDFISLSELEDIFGEDNGQTNLTQLLYRRFDEYIRALPGSVFTKLEILIKPFFAFKNIALFNYKELFHYFDYYLPAEILDKKYPIFRTTSAMIVIDHLERLYYALYYAMKNMAEEFSVDPEVLYVYEILDRGFSLKKDPDKIKEEKESIQNNVAVLQNHFYAVAGEITKFQAVVPLLDIIKYFRRDPFYRLKFYLPELHLKQVYQQALKKQLKTELDEKVFKIKDRVIERKILELFSENSMTPMENYTDTASDTYIRMGLPYFSRVRSLSLLYNYTRKVYRTMISEIMQIMNEYMFASQKRTQNRLVGVSSAIEELEDKIMFFDKSLSPEEDRGKTLHRLKYNITTDLSHQKLFKSFIYETDRDVQNFLEKGMENLNNFRNFLEEFFHGPTESTQTTLKTLVTFRGKQYTMRQLLQLILTNIDDFTRLLLQVMDMEKGR